MIAVDLTGQRFGQLVVQKRGGYKYGNRAAWLCLCDCGQEVLMVTHQLIGNLVKTCGCSRILHGMSKSRAHWIWRCMLSRCRNPKNTSYRHYGGRGITICNEWQESFLAFFNDMGHPPKGLTLDRKDNNGNYCKDNCHWVTQKQQMRNTRNSRFITFRDETKTLAEWEELSGMREGTIYQRLLRGWSMEKAMFTPLRTIKSQTK